MIKNFKLVFLLLIAGLIGISSAAAQGSTQFFGSYMPATDAYLAPGQMMFSETGKYFLTYQTDGNLVVYFTATKKAVWSSNTAGKPAYRAVMQSDGNFVVYSAPQSAAWSSATMGKPATFLRIQDDGNLVVYGGTNALWAAFHGGNMPRN
jgi:hypothetical protein